MFNNVVSSLDYPVYKRRYYFKVKHLFLCFKESKMVAPVESSYYYSVRC